jgi:hypothetical protein
VLAWNSNSRQARAGVMKIIKKLVLNSIPVNECDSLTIMMKINGCKSKNEEKPIQNV